MKIEDLIRKVIMDLGKAIGLDKEPQTERINTVNSHYGVTPKMANDMTKTMLANLILKDSKHYVLDKYFSRLTAEDRTKISCYTQAVKHYERMIKHAKEDKVIQ